MLALCLQMFHRNDQKQNLVPKVKWIQSQEEGKRFPFIFRFKGWWARCTLVNCWLNAENLNLHVWMRAEVKGWRPSALCALNYSSSRLGNSQRSARMYKHQGYRQQAPKRKVHVNHLKTGIVLPNILKQQTVQHKRIITHSTMGWDEKAQLLSSNRKDSGKCVRRRKRRRKIGTTSFYSQAGRILFLRNKRLFL